MSQRNHSIKFPLFPRHWGGVLLSQNPILPSQAGKLQWGVGEVTVQEPKAAGVPCREGKRAAGRSASPARGARLPPGDDFWERSSLLVLEPSSVHFLSVSIWSPLWKPRLRPQAPPFRESPLKRQHQFPTGTACFTFRAAKEKPGPFSSSSLQIIQVKGDRLDCVLNPFLF
jgi:hypothetical protein